jgi:hypothetical protein
MQTNEKQLVVENERIIDGDEITINLGYYEDKQGIYFAEIASVATNINNISVVEGDLVIKRKTDTTTKAWIDSMGHLQIKETEAGTYYIDNNGHLIYDPDLSI